MPQLDFTIISTQIFWLLLVLGVFYFLIVDTILPYLYYTLNLRKLILNFQICHFDILQKKLVNLKTTFMKLYLNKLALLKNIYLSELKQIKFYVYVLINKIFYFNTKLIIKYNSFLLQYIYKPTFYLNINLKFTFFFKY